MSPSPCSARLPSPGPRAASATLRGTVLDPSGGAVPGADVTVTSVRTKVARHAVSNSAGIYAVPALTSGPYRLEIRFEGCSSWESGEVHLSPGDSVNVDATLTLAEQTEEVTILSERQLTRDDHGAREGLITSEQIQSLSIIGRSAFELLRILPGMVTPDQSSMEAVGFMGFGAGANR